MSTTDVPLVQDGEMTLQELTTLEYSGSSNLARKILTILADRPLKFWELRDELGFPPGAKGGWLDNILGFLVSAGLIVYDAKYAVKSCTCKDDCPFNCKGECGCEHCRRAYADFLSME